MMRAAAAHPGSTDSSGGRPVSVSPEYIDALVHAVQDPSMGEHGSCANISASATDTLIPRAMISEISAESASVTDTLIPHIGTMSCDLSKRH